MRAIRLLSLRRLRLQPLRSAIAALSVAAGVSLAVAIVIVNASIQRSVDDFARTLAGPTPLRVVGATSRGGLADDVVPKIERTDGVGAVVPLVQAVTIGVDADGTERPVIALGVDCRIEHLVGELGCQPEALAAVGRQPLAASPSLLRDLGPDAALRTDVGRIPLRNVPEVPRLEELNDGSVLVFALPAAQELFARPGRIDVAYVDPAQGVAVDELRTRLEPVVGAWNGVLDADSEPPFIAAALSSFLPLFSLLGLFALGTGAVLVRNTVTLSLEERRRQLAVVSALGGTGRVVAGGALLEAGTLGLVGGVAGAALGALIASPITDSLSEFTGKIAGLTIDVHVDVSTVLVGALLGFAVGVGSAVGPARKALRLDVAAELSNRDAREEAGTPRTVARIVRWGGLSALGLVGCWVGQRDGALEPWQATVGPLSFVATSLFLLLTAAAVVPLVLSGLTRWSRGWPAAPRLGLSNLTREPRRTSVMATAVAAAVLVAFLTTSFTKSIRTQIRENLTANLHGVNVSTLDPNNSLNIEAKLSPEVLRRIEAMPEVAEVHRGFAVLAGHEVGDLIGLNAFEDPWLDLPMIEGTKDRTRFESGEVIIGPGLARRDGLRPGDTVRVPTPTGFAELPIMGIWQDGDFGGNNVALSYTVLEELYGPQPPFGVNVDPKPGVSDDELRAAILGANLDPDLRAYTAEQLADVVAEDIASLMTPFHVLQRALVLVAFVAVLTTLLLVGVQRRREFGLLGAVGMEPSTVSGMIVSEAGLVGVVGAIQGALFGLVMFWALLQITPVIVGYRDPYVPDWASLLPYGAVTLAVVVGAALLPARRAARLDVVEALQYE